mmetsp:Transcript_131670/g.328326  ORF Transcript_131670/g.328326 Transcript_131670/m.328326 type:complete len:324 (-) Transcript_131670:16-987(-)
MHGSYPQVLLLGFSISLLVRVRVSAAWADRKNSLGQAAESKDEDDVSVQIMRHGMSRVQQAAANWKKHSLLTSQAALLGTQDHQVQSHRGNHWSEGNNIHAGSLGENMSATVWLRNISRQHTDSAPKCGFEQPHGAHGSDEYATKPTIGTKDEGNLGEWCGYWAEFVKTVKCEARARKLECPRDVCTCCIASVPHSVPTSSERRKGAPIFKGSELGKCERLVEDEFAETIIENKEKNNSEWSNSSDPNLMLIDCTSGCAEADQDGTYDAEVREFFEKFRPWNDDPSTCCSGRVGTVRIEWFLHERPLEMNRSALYCAPPEEEV